jgi:glutaredoxin
MSFARIAALAALATGAAFAGLTAHAQVYRIVGPDGKVTFTDRPPEDAKVAPAQSVAVEGGGSPSASLPPELRKAVGQYPVTLYTTADCGPCGGARGFLRQRGIPFTEKTVNTRDDVAALQRLSGATSLPVLTIGGQQLQGFSQGEWGQYLDAAGYPATSQLPPGYRQPAPSPLVAVQLPAPRPAAQARPAPPPQAEAVPPSNGPNPANPAGIRF